MHLKVGSFSRDVEVAVCNDLTDDVLLGSDLGLDNLGNWLTQANTKLVCQTRAQAAQEQAQETVDREAFVNSGAETHTLGELFDFEDDFFAPEPVHATHPDPNPSGLTLPNLTPDSDKSLVIEQQANDFSLNTIRELANQQLRGYAYLDGVLIHSNCTDTLSPVCRVVLPTPRRPVALKLAHNSDFGGHCGVKRTLKRLYPSVTWPNISRDVASFIKSCPDCQRQAKDPRHKAPLCPMPLVGRPFKRIAFDLVGPYPRTKGNHRYLLTSICYFSRCPEAIPLSKINEV